MGRLIQLVKFGIVGLVNNIIYYLVYLLLIRLNVHYLGASILGFISSVGNAYYWNSRYVFAETKKGSSSVRCRGWKPFLKTFFAYAGTGLVLNNLLLVFWIDVLGISKSLSPMINLCITVPVNFVLNKYWAFKQSSEK